ncbi:endoplasmic reticulum protein [Obba rivulosa]|uniref:Glucosidase 2 subunit beta n=1 Tax=Obba rivulosa TaxID=1052685 RepID=A0A8E2DU52_9APHY|nr:endoplasmic reticulum protein [Obba rivulosa]
MLPWLLLLFPASIFAAETGKTHGVSPALLSRYVPSTVGSEKTWSCLNGSKTIPWAAVNDDYCDCPDGSDEPGTGACSNTVFYCQNEGHIGARIPSSRVRDGLCEPECCDGSDELPGVCKNTCKEVGAAYRAKVEEENKIRKTGAKIRSSYINFAQKEKSRLEEKIASLEKDISAQEKEVARLKDIADRTESLSAAALEQKKQSPLYQSFMTHVNALKSLQREHKKHLEREKILEDILDNLRSNYNPNYQDMAVLEAVRGWEAQAGLPHINDVGKDGASEEEEKAKAEEESQEELEPGMWSAGQLEYDLDNLLGTDYETLLLEHERHIGAPASGSDSILFDATAYIPDALLPQYVAVRSMLLSWLEALGLTHKAPSDAAADTSRAQQAAKEADNALGHIKQDKQKAQEELSRIFDPEWYGLEGEWKKLHGTCIDKDTGDYTYEVCFFEEAKQKPNKGGASHSLGRFSSWNDADGVTLGSTEYYSRMYYTRGTKCWNGPHRSATLLVSCGVENALLSVAEPEKCEYHFKITSPAACLPLETTKESRDEL